MKDNYISIIKDPDKLEKKIKELATQVAKGTSKTSTKVMLVLVQLYKSFRDEDMLRKSADMTYSTILSIVPTLAIGFSVVRGFGKEKELWDQIELLAGGDGHLSNRILTSVHRSVELTTDNSGLFFAVAVAVLLCTANSAMYKFEKTINEIWDVKITKGWLDRLPLNVFFLFLVPIIISFFGGLTGVFHQITFGYHAIAEWPIRLIIAIAFLLLVYKFLPEIKVDWLCALFSAIIAGTLLIIWHFVFLTIQDSLFNYNKLYGSFAAIPFFIAWTNISWLICLFGAKTSVIFQNIFLSKIWNPQSVESLENEKLKKKFDILLVVICYFIKNKGGNIEIIKLTKESRFPIYYVMYAINTLQKMDLISEVKKNYNSYYSLTPCISSKMETITVMDFFKMLVDNKQIGIKKDNTKYTTLINANKSTKSMFDHLESSENPTLQDISKIIFKQKDKISKEEKQKIATSSEFLDCESHKTNNDNQ